MTEKLEVIIGPEVAQNLITGETIQILELLSKKRPLSIWDIERQVDQDAEQVGKLLQNLVEHGVVDVETEEDSTRYRFDFNSIKISFEDTEMKDAEGGFK